MVISTPRKDIPPQTPPRSPWRVVAIVAIAVGAVVVAALAAVVATRNTSGKPTHTVTVSVTPSPAAPGSPSGSPSAPGGSSSTPPSSAAPAPPFQLGYQPLYPFATRAGALAWMASYRSGGHQPWHLDAALTAQSFVAWLRFTEIDLITSARFDSLGAHVGVGYRNPNGVAQTAAILHLVRFGPEADAPWEIVGSDDTTFSLETPAYGSRISSPVTVGGHITGVDENIRVSVWQLPGSGPLGRSAGIPAGGENQPWSGSVRFTGAAEHTLTIVATTGGHLQAVERFAIQGVRY